MVGDGAFHGRVPGRRDGRPMGFAAAGARGR